MNLVTKNDIVEHVIRLLRQHEEGLRGSIRQDAYKHDFFALFAEAYNAGLMDGGGDTLRADALNDAIIDRSPELVDGETWRTLHGFWSDWTYAWDHASERQA